jgi:ethanolamine utilization protein EutA
LTPARDGVACGDRSADGSVHLIGLDFGSTTSSALMARARIASHSVTGRLTFATPEIVHRPPTAFTPFIESRIDERQVMVLVDQWIADSGIAADRFFAGGALVTGLAARSDNAAAITRIVGERIGEAVVATADDPSLESWLAFMGSCSTLSRFHADMPILNLDIGGGTTNTALGRDGAVLTTGCHFIGARHFQVRPGSHELVAISPYGRALLSELGIERSPGQTLRASELDAIIDWYVAALEAIVRGDHGFFASDVGRLHEQVRFTASTMGSDTSARQCAITFSGGVGELLYRHAAGEALPPTTAYGDLGIDLARRIARSPLLSRDLHTLVPEQRGRATVYGLALHSTEVSGSSLFLPHPETLPLRHLPIVARLGAQSNEASIERAVDLAAMRSQGACIQLTGDLAGHERIKALGLAIGDAMRRSPDAALRPLVLLTQANVGQALGNYASDWGRSPLNLIVIDELPDRPVHFAHIGRPRDGIVPVSFYGMHC